ncbi:MAG: hypothetical protein JNN01_04860 [Opitutaceae bacterium]|nr:hypothetical protein [Opitutaceae bacterium]
MKNTSLISLLAGIAIAGFSGCESTGVSSRIQEKSAVFATLTPAEQAAIKEGAIDVGYTADMAYMALGKPTVVETKETSQGKMETWIYKKYYGTRGEMTPMLNGPTQRYQGNVTGPNAPSHGKGSEAPGLGDTKSGPKTSLDVPDMVSSILYVYLLEGKVFSAEIKPDR